MKKSIAILLIVLSTVCAASAQTTAFTYQGSLSDGASPAAGNYDFEFALYDAASGGAQLGATLTRPTIAVANGIFAVSLDFGGQFPGANRFLEIRVRLTGQPGITILSPRQQVNSAPYSVKTLNADTAVNATNATNATTAATATNATQLGGQAAAFYQDATNLNAGTLNAARLPVPLSLTGSVNFDAIISGTNSSTSGRGVYGWANAATGTTYGGRFESSSTNGRGVFGWAGALTGTTYGVYGQSTSTNGRGVFGFATAAAGITFGGYFQSASTNGNGVFGWATAATGFTDGVSGRSDSPDGRGVFGEASAPTGVTHGGRFESASTNGNGVFGWASATTGTNYGVRGQSNSTNGRGVYGVATAATGINFGGYFEADSTLGFGVYGYAAATTGTTYGGRFDSASTSGLGILGNATAATGTTYGVWGVSTSTSGRGVYGLATEATGTNYGVRGHTNSPDGYGGFFSGRGYFSGNVGLGVLTPTFRLHLSTDSAAKPTSSSWTISSDRRLKKNIRPIDGALDQLMHLRGVTYQWKDPASQGDMAGTYTGMIAQDVEKVFPEWIREDANGFKTLTVIGFEGIVVEALRELRAEKDAEISGLQSVVSGQQDQISSQQSQNEAQQTQIEEQRKLIETQQAAIDELKLIVCSLKPEAKGCSPR